MANTLDYPIPNQRGYAQRDDQRGERGLPITVLVSMADGCVRDAAIDRARQRETAQHALFRGPQQRI